MFYHDVSMYLLKDSFLTPYHFFVEILLLRGTIISLSCLAAPTGICVTVLGLHN